MMLHQDVLLADIDVDHWRNAQTLLLRSAKQCRRLVVIHENGRVLKFRHTHDLPVRGRVRTVVDPHRHAQRLYELNRDVVDFVVVLDRDAVDAYFAHVQDAWNIEDDIDDYVHKTYAALDSYPDGIVTYPGPARTTLGLQWRIGASHDQLRTAVKTLVPPRTTVILGVVSGGELWTSLILDVDDNHRIISITTADPSQVDIHGTPAVLAERLTSWAENTGKTVSSTLVLSHNDAVDLLATPAEEKGARLATLLAAGSGSLRRT